MGEVYRARDTRLARDVAIKVLPESLACDQERLRRFEKEARSASALNHPNIVTIHDIGSEGGVSYIAMELVDGATLRELLATGPVPLKRLLQIAPQVAEGLARAHEAGIVHRDLKPENVMVKKDGLVKILDFGLAKLSSTGSGSDEASQLPTMTGTQPGVVVGTVSYMSPEQASGQTVDFRSDQFSLGSMLYEMATGRRAFQKRTAIDTLSAILNDEPQAIGMVNPLTPAPLRWIVERCLAKEARGRYASTEDLARDLGGLRDHASEGSSGAIVSPQMPRAPGRRWFAAVASGIALVAVGAIANRWWQARTPNLSVPSFQQLTFRRGNVVSARFTPDGRTVVYGAAWDGAPMEIYTVRTDSTESRPLGLRNAMPLAVSSRGELAALLRTNNLQWGGVGTIARLPLGGGTPRELLKDGYNADWAPNGEDLAAVRLSPSGNPEIQYPIGNSLGEFPGLGGTVRVSPDGDRLAIVERDAIVMLDRKGKRTVISRGWLAVNELVWSPNGKELLLLGARAENTAAIYAVSLSGQIRVLISNAGSFAVLYDVSSDGRLLVELNYGRGGVACQPRGEARERDLGWRQFSVPADISEDGSLLLFGDGLLRKTDGSLPVHLADGSAQALSEDNQWALMVKDGQLLMTPTGAGVARRIPVDGIDLIGGAILPGGKGFLVGGRDKKGAFLAAVVGPKGGKPRLLQVDGYVEGKDFVVSPDGEKLAYPGRDGQLKILSIAGGQIASVSGSSLNVNDDRLVQWSADGKFVYVTRPGEFPGPVDRIDIATGRRESWKRLSPEDPVGVTHVDAVRISRDGQSYAYFYNRVLASDLYIISGVR